LLEWDLGLPEEEVVAPPVADGEVVGEPTPEA
jgi:hypothetical protein